MRSREVRRYRGSNSNKRNSDIQGFVTRSAFMPQDSITIMDIENAFSVLRQERLRGLVSDQAVDGHAWCGLANLGCQDLQK